MATEARKHRWRFFRAGGFEQVRLDRKEDLRALDQLDQKLWVALSCPTQGIEFDPKTLEIVDTDNDGRIRAPEILGAVKWTCSVLEDPASIIKGSPKLPLAAIDGTTEEGQRLLASARALLTNLGKKDATEVTLEDTGDTARIFAQTRFNGDGIIPPSAADDPEVAKALAEIVAVMGGEADRSGEIGVNQAKVDTFFAEAAAFDAWWRAAESDAANVLPLGEATAAAAKTFRAVSAKIDDYFTRARLAAFDEHAAEPLNRHQAEYIAMASRMLTPRADEVASFPLAKIEAYRPLPLEKGVNPAWAEAIEKLRVEVVAPLLGDQLVLSEKQWEVLSARFEAFEKWLSAKAGAIVESLGLQRVRELLAGSTRARIDDLLTEDRAHEPEAAAIASVEKLVLFHRDLYRLLNNFITFRDFYHHKKATFQVGTLYLDGRSCDLCVPVKDATGHATLATLSGIYLVYCDVTRHGHGGHGDHGEKMTIAAAFTAGDSTALMVGRNGLFYDRKGNDWDATIIKIVEHPISVRQAFWAPYRRVGRLISEQVEKFADSRDREAQEKAAANVAHTAVAAKPDEDKMASAFDLAKFAGIFAAIGLVIAAVGTAIAATVTGFMSLLWWQMLLVLFGAILLISGPSMLIAYLKLRKRNIGPLLDANGWAVNARAKLNIPFGRSLTAVARLPADAERSFEDPFEEASHSRLVLALVVALALGGGYLWWTGRLQRWIHEIKMPTPAVISTPSGAPTP